MFSETQATMDQLRVVYGAKKETLVMSAIDTILFLAKERAAKEAASGKFLPDIALQYEDLAEFLTHAARSCLEHASKWREADRGQRSEALDQIIKQLHSMRVPMGRAESK